MSHSPRGKSSGPAAAPTAALAPLPALPSAQRAQIEGKARQHRLRAQGRSEPISSSGARPQRYLRRLAAWAAYRHTLPADVHAFDWRTFQQEYRDYIDLAKIAQLVPVIGAAVGAVANYKLVEQLGETAMNCYRMRHFAAEDAAR